MTPEATLILAGGAAAWLSWAELGGVLAAVSDSGGKAQMGFDDSEIPRLLRVIVFSSSATVGERRGDAICSGCKLQTSQRLGPGTK